MSRRFARPYAKALLQTAGSTDNGVAVRDDLRTFLDAMKSVPELRKMAQSPAVPQQAKESTLTQICAHLELGELSQRFIQLLARNFRLHSLEAILDAVESALNLRLGIVRADVTTARPLDPGQHERLAAALRRVVGGGQEIEIQTHQDASLLAGFVARIGSRRFDASLAGQIERLAETLAEPA